VVPVVVPKLAAADNFRAAVYDQAAAMREHYGEWRAAVERRIDGHEAAVRELVAKLNDEFSSLAVDRELRRALEYFNGDPGNWTFIPPRPEALERSRRKAADQLPPASRCGTARRLTPAICTN
jgi:hypothetical protein